MGDGLMEANEAESVGSFQNLLDGARTICPTAQYCGHRKWPCVGWSQQSCVLSGALAAGKWVT